MDLVRLIIRAYELPFPLRCRVDAAIGSSATGFLPHLSNGVQPTSRSFDDGRQSRVLEAVLGGKQVIALEDSFACTQLLHIVQVFYFGPQRCAHREDAPSSTAKHAQQTCVFNLAA
jgi:hypothetical protein